MTYEIEVVDLTDAQARELHRMVGRAIDMYDERDGGENITESLRILKKALSDVMDGEKDEIKFSIGMRRDERERIANIIEIESSMEQKKISQGWGMDRRRFKALTNGIDTLRNPEIREIES